MSNSDLLKLFCWVLGGTSQNIFQVNIPSTESVAKLKGAIKDEKKNTFDSIDADSLVLYKISVTENAISTRLGTIDLNSLEALQPTHTLSRVFSVPPPENELYIVIVQPPAAPAAVFGTKRHLDEAIDPSDNICANLLRPFDDIPKRAEDLVSLIQVPLLQKVPVMDWLFESIRLTNKPISEFLQPATGEPAMVFTFALVDSTGRRAAAGGSEDMMHSVVDALVRLPLDVIGDRVGKKLPIEMDRNRTDPGTTTKAYCRPDFLLWVRDTLLFWGEEKAVSGAKEDLEEKFREIDPVVFGEINFMICYAANGPKIQFFAVNGTQNLVDPFIALTEQLDITKLVNRLEVLQTIINIARIIVTIKDILPTVAYPLAKKKKRGVSEITFGADCVVKKVAVADLPYSQTNLQHRIDFLYRMYAHAQGRRGLVRVKDGPKLNKRGTHYTVTLATRGITFWPKNEGQLQSMTKDLVCGLARLHSGGYLHRDIRSPNVIYDPANQEYVLLDFEHGGQAGSTLTDDSTHLTGWDDGTLDGGIYTKASDMYQLGKLLRKDFSSMIVSKPGGDFVSSLAAKRMTAEVSLNHEWIRSLT